MSITPYTLKKAASLISAVIIFSMVIFAGSGGIKAQSYCMAYGGCAEYISNVMCGSIANSSSCNGYQDFTSLTTSMAKGLSYPIVVEGGAYVQDQCAIWVDWNKDGDFLDQDESIIVSGTPGVGPYTANIMPPTGAILGNTRMRIRVSYTGSLSPCGGNTFGEVEDYTIDVMPPCTPPVITGTTPALKCGAGSVTLGASANFGTIRWYTAAHGGAPIAYGTTYVTPSLSSSTTYYVDVIDAGCVSPSRTPVAATINYSMTVTGPYDQSAYDGDDIYFVTNPTGGGPYTYIWQVSQDGGSTWTSISCGGTGPVYTGCNSNTLGLLGIVPANNHNLYRCLITNGCGYIWSDTAELTVLYCAAYGGCTEYISQVDCGNIYNSTSGCLGYSDYTLMSTSMAIGVGYSMTVTNGAGFPDDQVGIWIDWNNDGDFYEANESMPVSGNPGLGPYTATITPPAGSVLGNTRMRIRLSGYGTLYPCDYVSFGEVEDYTVHVIPHCDPPAILSTNSASLCGDGSVVLGATPSAGTVQWYTAAHGGTPVATGNTYTTPFLTTSTVYYVDAIDSGCVTPARVAVTAGVNDTVTVTAPYNQLAGIGSSTSFSVYASGGSPYVYQWQVSTDGGITFTNITTAGTAPVYSGWTTPTLGLAGVVMSNDNYQYRCYVSNGCSTISEAGTLYVTNCTAFGGCTEYISNVSCGSINNTSACNGYSNFTTLCTEMGTGFGYAITVTNGAPYLQDQCRVWIDWNNDGDFDDPNETIILAGSPGLGPYSASFNPPNDAVTASTRMRVRLDFNETPLPCGITTFGEVEDYCVNVTNCATDFPTTPGPIAGSIVICAGSMQTYTITAVPHATYYNWSVPAGWAISSGQGTTSITIIAGSSAGDISVNAANVCGSSSDRTIHLTVNPKPFVDLGNDTLLCVHQNITLDAGAGSGLSYLWSNGKTTQTIIVYADSISPNDTLFSVTVTNTFNCQASDDIIILPDPCTGLDELSGRLYVNCYPNPASDLLYISFAVTTEARTEITLVNVLGQQMFSEVIESLSGPVLKQVDLRGFPDGIYFLKIKSGTDLTGFKIIVE